MPAVFCDSQGVFLARFLQWGDTETATSYCNILPKLRDAVRRKRLGLLTRGILIHYDNARPHSARLTQKKLKSFGGNIRLTAQTLLQAIITCLVRLN
ncbi:hypothetical protein AVEN_208274-1 [Araneus ventricosus]|uniref:Mariner Mos1 transposase n=1 Tax=Araneus ventricosus TaxID=182803 RepID=A0A4Y2TPJ8_ARAVE|nr:hypothetical protein AVEN_208274-1 [Araneus ventricosus]